MHELVNKSMTEDELASMGEAKKLTVSLGCGVVAGFSAAILSHVCLFPLLLLFRMWTRDADAREGDLPQPGDTLLSQINKGHGPGGPMISRLATLAKEAGFRGLFAGLGPRMISPSSSRARSDDRRPGRRR